MQVLSMVLAANGHWVVTADQPAFPKVVNSISWVVVVQLIVLPIVIPVLTGLLTRVTWPTFVKRIFTGVLTLVTSVLTGIIGAVSTNTPYDIGSAILQWLLVWGVAELAYYGLYKAPINTNPDPSTPSTIAEAVGRAGVK